MSRRLSIFTLFALLTCACAESELGSARSARMTTFDGEWRDQVIYQALTDRFANGDARTDYGVRRGSLARYQGGDFQGLIDRLDYLEALGVTAIWISPIVLNVDTDAGVDGYHGYWAIDLERVNPHFGDIATLRRFVEFAHRKNMRVILDIVTNHLGQVFYYDINGNGQPDEQVLGSGGRSPITRSSEYDPDYDPRGIRSFTSLGESGLAEIRFFDMPQIFRVAPQPAIFQAPEAYNRRGRVTDWNVRDMVLYGDFPGGLKDLNTESPMVREELVRLYTRWILQTNIDGFRIDTIKHVEYGFWDYFAPEVRRRLAEAGKRNFFMFGEAFDGNDELIGSYTQEQRLDSVFYFSQKFRVFDDVFMRGASTRQIEALYNERAVHFSGTAHEMGTGIPAQQLVNFIDNHDVPRFLYERNDELGQRRLHAALTYLLTEDGIPCIYYGTEQNFAGGNDPANREVLWQSGYRQDGPTFQHIARLARVRRENVALRRGNFAIRWVTDRTGLEEDAGIVAFERVTEAGDYALVVINTNPGHDSSTSFNGSSMLVTAAAGTQLHDALGGSASYVVASDQRLRVTVPALTGVVLVR